MKEYEVKDEKIEFEVISEPSARCKCGHAKLFHPSGDCKYVTFLDESWIESRWCGCDKFSKSFEQIIEEINT